MNETLLALLSALAIYGLTSFALPKSDFDTRDDATDIHSGEVAVEPPAADEE